jgi:hypothetical protein
MSYVCAATWRSAVLNNFTFFIRIQEIFVVHKNFKFCSVVRRRTFFENPCSKPLVSSSQTA